MSLKLRLPLPDPILEGHKYYSVVGITSPTTTAAYQHYLVVYHQPGMAPDFRDLRFTDPNGIQCPHWVESYTAGVSAVVWINIPVGSTPFVRMYYSNLQVSSVSNGDKTFDFFDHFLGSSINPSKWTCSGNMTYDLTDSILTLTGVNNANGRMVCNTAYGTDYVWRSRSKWSGNGGSSVFGFLDWNTFNNLASIWDTAGYAGYVVNAGTSTNSGTSVDANWHIYEIARNGSSSVIFRRDGTTYWSTTNCPSVSMPLICRQYASGYSQKHDWVAVRKYTATEPTLAVITRNERNPGWRG